MLKYNLENTFKPIFCNINSMEDFDTFTKKQYNDIIVDERKKFIHNHFLPQLDEIFEHLKNEAKKMIECDYEIKMDIPHHFDGEKMRVMLELYFRDLGYKSKAVYDDNMNIVKVTLT